MSAENIQIKRQTSLGAGMVIEEQVEPRKDLIVLQGVSRLRSKNNKKGRVRHGEEAPKGPAGEGVRPGPGQREESRPSGRGCRQLGCRSSLGAGPPQKGSHPTWLPVPPGGRQGA